MSIKMSTRLQCPRKLKGREERALWKSIVESYDANHFNKSDIPLLIRFIQAAAIAEQSFKVISDEGVTIDSQRGITTHPAIKAWSTAVNVQSALAAKLRISPSSRVRPEDGTQSSRRAKTGKVFDPSSNWRDFQVESQVQ